jgi:hypothetical protein
MRGRFFNLDKAQYEHTGVRLDEIKVAKVLSSRWDTQTILFHN